MTEQSRYVPEVEPIEVEDSVFQDWCRSWHRACGWNGGPPNGLYSGDSLRAAFLAGMNYIKSLGVSPSERP